MLGIVSVIQYLNFEEKFVSIGKQRVFISLETSFIFKVRPWTIDLLVRFSADSNAPNQDIKMHRCN